jgi:integrase/recombinase XerC
MKRTINISPIPTRITTGATDPVAELLRDKRSAATKRAYRGDLIAFFGGEPAPETVLAFVAQPTADLARDLAAFKARMIGAGLSEATVNRRLSAVRALLKFSHRAGHAQTDGRGLVDGERVQSYRDTRGVGMPDLRKLVNSPDKGTLKGLRDRAMLRLLSEIALRRAELCALDVADFDMAARRLLVTGKGHGTQKEPMTLSAPCASAIASYLLAAGHGAAGGALFRGLSRASRGRRLTPTGLHYVVGETGKKIGQPKLTPHKLRHSAITEALNLSGGDVRKVKRLSRHAQVATVLRYDDNRQDLQGDLTRQLAAAIGGED